MGLEQTKQDYHILALGQERTNKTSKYSPWDSELLQYGPKKKQENSIKYYPHLKKELNTYFADTERHDGAVGSVLGFESRHQRSKPGHDNCVEALSPQRVTAVGKLLTLGGDWPSFTFITTLWSSECGLSVVSNKRILLLLLW